MPLLKTLRSVVAATAMIFAAALTLASCSESDEPDNEYTGWKSRNAAYFADTMRETGDSIAAARRQFGSNWEQYSNRRQYLCYSRLNGSEHTLTDSVAVQIVRRGTGVQRPFTTDSVRIAYRTLLMPTKEHPAGLVVDHTGVSTEFDRVFDRNTMATTNFRVSALVRGVATAMLYMHPGDLWRVTIPSTLAYGDQNSARIPGGSTIIFEMELVGINRGGIIYGIWR